MNMNVQALIDFFWPFHQIGTRSIEDGTPEHMHASIRMRNRWQLHKMQPFIVLWVVLSAALGLLLSGVGDLSPTLATVLLGELLLSIWVASLAILGFMVWLYSMGPK